MELFIRIKDNKPFEHPIIKENLLQAFPDIDLNNLPSEFAKFVRVPLTVLGPYEVLVESKYEFEGNVVKDVDITRTMTDEEKIQKQNNVKNEWLVEGRFPSWIFNEELCAFEPPIPYPTDGKKYFWSEPIVNWELVKDIFEPIDEALLQIQQE